MEYLILKIAEIDISQVSNELLLFIKDKWQTSYTDAATALSEDLHHIDEVFINEIPVPEILRIEYNAFRHELKALDITYFRLVRN